MKLVVVSGKNQGREIPIRIPEFLIGRAEGCHLRPGGAASERISRKHCAICIKEGIVSVVDFHSTNHTFVNGRQVAGRRELKNGDRLLVGGWLEFEVHLILDISGKKKPKVTSIQEAAARTVQSSTAKEDDVDLSDWFSGEEDGTSETTPAVDLASIKETTTLGHKVSDTTTIVPSPKEKEEGKSGDKKGKKSKTPGHLIASRPLSDSSHSAANDTLRQFFNRKK